MFCAGHLPKQSTEDLEQIASKLRNSSCEILDPPFDDEGKVRLCSLDEPDICGAVNRRYLHSVPVVFVHYPLDYDESKDDDEAIDEYYGEWDEKLKKDNTQSVAQTPSDIQKCTNNVHVLTKLSLDEWIQRFGTSYPIKIAGQWLNRKIIPIAHRIHEVIPTTFFGFEEIRALQSCPKQSYYPFQRPQLHIHLFPNKESFISRGGDLHDKIISDSKQIAMISSPDPQQLTHCAWYFRSMNYRIADSWHSNGRLFMDSCRIFGHPQVLKDKKRLARGIQTLFELTDKSTWEKCLDQMSNLPDYKFQFGAKIKEIKKLSDLMGDGDYRLHRPWGKEGENVDQEMSLIEKSKLLDAFLKEWDNVIIAALGLRNADKPKGFWSFFFQSMSNFWEEEEPDTEECIEQGMATDVVILWRAAEFYLDPSYTINIILLEGPDMHRALLQESCLDLGYSWKEMRRCIQWIDYGDATSEA